MSQGSTHLSKLERERLKGEFIEWLVLDKAARRSWGLPTTITEFADAKGVNPRTLRRWREEPAFDRKLVQRQIEVAQGSPNGTVAPPKVTAHGRPHPSKRHDPPAPVEPKSHPELVDLDIDDPGRRDYEHLKAQLRDRALSGEGEKALELYMKWFGAPYLEAERQARESSFTELSDADLIDRTLDIIGEDNVRSWLEGRA